MTPGLTAFFRKVSRVLKPCDAFAQSVAASQYDVKILFNLVWASATFLKYSFVAFWDLDFEPVIVSLLSCHYSQTFQSEIITLFSKSSTQWICLHHFLHIPPSLNNYPYWTAASSTFHSRTFSNLRVAVMLQRWFCRLKFCLNPMDTYYFAYLSLTSTQLYILAMTFWARVRCGSKHHLIFCLQSSCRHIFRSSKIFFGDVSYHFGESQLCASFLWQGIQPST